MSSGAHARTMLCLAPCATGAATAEGIERALTQLPGVSRVHVNRLTEMAYVEHDVQRCSREELAATLRAAEGSARSAMDRARTIDSIGDPS
jgi:cation transport ATPase